MGAASSAAPRFPAFGKEIPAIRLSRSKRVQKNTAI